MNKLIYRFAILIALINWITNLLGGIGLLTALIRSTIVFLGILGVFAVFLNLLSWGLRTFPNPPPKEENNENTALTENPSMHPESARKIDEK